MNDKQSVQTIEVELDPLSAQALKVQEFDKQIAEAEAVVADLKKQRATFIYESSIQMILKSKQPSK